MTTRYSDIGLNNNRLPAVTGYINSSILPLKIAVESLLRSIPNLDQWVHFAFESCCQDEKYGLTKDESAAIFLYSLELGGEQSFYRRLNNALRDECRPSLIPFFNYLKILDTGMNKLPSLKMSVWRGISKDLSSSFREGQIITWLGINSCSTKVDVIKQFIGASSNSTLFLIECLKGKDVSKFTHYAAEYEVILMPGTQLQVVANSLQFGGGHIVHLKEIEKDKDVTAVAQSLNSLSVSDISTTAQQRINEIKTINYPNGSKYIGEVNEKDELDGKGTMWWNEDPETSIIYEGQFKEGKVDGYGIYQYSSSSKYIRYEGEYQHGKRNGRGVLVHFNGNRYEGNWVDGMQEGQGTETWLNGDQYKGQFRYGMKNDLGTMNFSTGDKYQGRWLNGLKEGRGLFTWKNGDRYEGEFRNDFISGHGIKYFHRGGRYEGEFKDGMKHGFGRLTYGDGGGRTGRWQNDQLVQRSKSGVR